MLIDQWFAAIFGAVTEALPKASETWRLHRPSKPSIRFQALGANFITLAIAIQFVPPRL
jgi:hypothetical protein